MVKILIKTQCFFFWFDEWEEGDVNTNTINDWKEKLKLIHVCKRYEPKNSLHMDETDPFFKETTRKTLFVKEDDCGGGKNQRTGLLLLYAPFVRGKGQTFTNCPIQKSQMFEENKTREFTSFVLL